MWKKKTIRFLKNCGYISYAMVQILQFQFMRHRIQNMQKAETKTDILFSTYLMNWRKVNRADSSTNWNDIMLGDITKRVSREFQIMIIDEDPHHKFRDYKKTISKVKSCNFCLPIEEFVDIKSILKAYILSLKNLLGNAQEEYDEFMELTGQDGRMGGYLNLLTAKKILDSVRPRLVFLSCEYGTFHRALTYASKKRNIPVMALQHGIITPRHSGYVFKNERMRRIIPDLTCVYGTKYKDILVKESLYKEEMVAVTGSPRYDFLHDAEVQYSRQEVLEKFNIPESRAKIILWTTQTHGLPNEENKANLNCVLKTMLELKGVTLVIKQHPGETKSNTALIEKYIEKYQPNNVILAPKNSDTYELIFACDIMITRHSTTAVEAVSLNKPVILMNLTKEPDGVDYVKEGVALPVKEMNGLKNAIEKLLNDDSVLAVNREKYIREHLYKIDGMAAERAMQQITRMIEKNN